MTANAPTTSLFLSRLILDLRSRQVWRELAQPYEMHRTLMHAFKAYPVQEGEKLRDKFDVLFRAEAEEFRQRVVVYVQSNVAPDWSFFTENQGYLYTGCGQPNPAWKEVTESFAGIEAGQKLSFRLRANPTMRIRKVTTGGPELKGKRVGLLREEEQIAWLIRKGQEREKGKPGGFELLMDERKANNGNPVLLPRLIVRNDGKLTSRKRDGDQGHAMTHWAVNFDGLLRVTNADDFRDTLAAGIGSAKAFGFGLLSVAP